MSVSDLSNEKIRMIVSGDKFLLQTESSNSINIIEMDTNLTRILSQLDVCGNMNLNNYDISDVNTLYATSLSGTLLTPYQPNITGVGQLTINNAFTFPANIGTNDQILTVPSSGTLLEWTDLNTLINLQNYSDASLNYVDISNLLYVKGDASFNNNISVTGSITALQFIGDGSLLTGINLAEFDDLSTNFIDLSTNYYSYVNANDTSVNNIYTRTTDLSGRIHTNTININDVSTNLHNLIIGDVSNHTFQINDLSTNLYNYTPNLKQYDDVSFGYGNFLNDLVVDGSFTVQGNLYVNGTHTIINSSTIDVSDHTILLASNASTAVATHNAGLEVSGNKTFLYDYYNNRWTSNIDISASNITNIELKITDLSTNYYLYRTANDTSVNNVNTKLTDLSTNYYLYRTANDTSLNNVNTKLTDLSTNYYLYRTANDTSVNSINTKFTDLSTNYYLYRTANDTSVNNVYNITTDLSTNYYTYKLNNDTSVNNVTLDLSDHLVQFNTLSGDVISLSSKINDVSNATTNVQNQVDNLNIGTGIFDNGLRSTNAIGNASYGIALGHNSNAGLSSVSVGQGAGTTNQGFGCLAIGQYCGETNQSNYSTAIGYRCGISGEGTQSLCIGYFSTTEQNNTIVLNVDTSGLIADLSNAFYVKPIRNVSNNNALYYNSSTGEITFDISGTGLIYDLSSEIFDISGKVTDISGKVTDVSNALTDYITNTSVGVIISGTNMISTFGDEAISGFSNIVIGRSAGTNNMTFNNLFIGLNAGDTLPSNQSNIIGLGCWAGRSAENKSVNVGVNAGYYAKSNAVNIGFDAGFYSGYSSVNIGYRASYQNPNSTDYTIVLNATNVPLEPDVSNAFYVKPVQNKTFANVLYYNPSTGEISYDASGGGTDLTGIINDISQIQFDISNIPNIKNDIDGILFDISGIPLIETTINEIGTALEIVINDISGITNMETKITDISGRVFSNETKVTDISGRVWTNTNNISTNTTNINDISGRVWTNTSNISTNTTNINDISGRVFTNDNKITDVSAILFDLSQNIVYPLKASHEDLSTNFSNLNIGVYNANLGLRSLDISAECGAYGIGLGYYSVAKDYSVSIGFEAGKTNSSANSIAIGSQAGNLDQSNNCIAIGTGAGQIRQLNRNVALGYFAGYTDQSGSAVAIGSNAGNTNQGGYGIAIGNDAGYNTQGRFSIGIGHSAQKLSNKQSSIAIGYYAGYTDQSGSAVAIGTNAGEVSQDSYGISIGHRAGNSNQGFGSTAIGYACGETNQDDYCIALGYACGILDQSSNSICIGFYANSKFKNSIVLNGGINSLDASYNDALYINPIRNYTNTDASNILVYNTNTKEIQYTLPTIYKKGNHSIVSYYADGSDFGISLGYNTNINSKGTYNVSIGYEANNQSSGNNSISIGSFAGFSNDLSCGDYSIALGYSAGYNYLHSGCIILNATNSSLNSVDISRCYIAPIRFETSDISKSLFYDTTTKEVVYKTPALYNKGTYGLVSNLDGDVSHNGISIGFQASKITPKEYNIAIGRKAGYNNMGNDISLSYCIAIGDTAGENNQRQRSICIGRASGNNYASDNSICIGDAAGYLGCEIDAILMGRNAGYNGSGQNCIYIGANAGYDSSVNDCIVLNATGSALNTISDYGFYVKPIKPDLNNYFLAYDITSGQITHQSGLNYIKNLIYDGSFVSLKLDPLDASSGAGIVYDVGGTGAYYDEDKNGGVERNRNVLSLKSNHYNKFTDSSNIELNLTFGLRNLNNVTRGTIDYSPSTTNRDVLTFGAYTTGIYSTTRTNGFLSIAMICDNYYVFGTTHCYGQLRYYAGIVNACDKRIKNNIIDVSYNDAWDMTKKLNLYSYNYNNQNEKPNKFGLIAQDVLEVYPEAIYVEEGDFDNTGKPIDDKTQINEDTLKTLYSVDKMKVFELLLASHKAGQEKIEVLETKVDTLQTELAELKNILRNLQI